MQATRVVPWAALLALTALSGCGAAAVEDPDDDAGNLVLPDAETDPCAQVQCDVGEVCQGGVCLPKSDAGQDVPPDAETDPCDGVRCGTGEVCQGGQCVSVSDDRDNDGYPAGEDCNDLDPLVHPAAAETCDGRDNNCNGTRDEGFDNDGDGFASCPGAQQDCDDNDATVHPGADEICDGIDNDCNGQVDDSADNDSDGYGECGPQPDCDDHNPSVHPGATEVCNDVDDNCNGTNNEGNVCVGCSDGARDALANQTRWPQVAGCAGTFARQSLRSPRTNTPCGDDMGQACNAPEDLCAPGWHLCMRNGDPYDLRFRLTAAECRSVSGSYVAATDHCNGPTDVMPSDDCTPILTPPYGCRASGFCTGPVVCGGAEHSRCMHSVWPLSDGGTFTFSRHAGRAEDGGGCSDFDPSKTYSSDLTGGTISFSGVLCCRD